MGKIQKLSPLIISQIAAGEVIESPRAVVKELIENSLDAKAQKIEVFCHKAGLETIQVRDDGEGILPEDLPLALESFATSKISNFSQIFSLESFGFRGEALAAIRSIARIFIESRYKNAPEGYSIKADPEKIYESEVSAIPLGTRVVVENLFFNTPVRKKFLKDEKFLEKEIIGVVTNLSLAHPNVHFSLHFEENLRLYLPKAKDLLERISSIYGSQIEKELMPLYYREDELILEGFISAYHFYRSSPIDIRFFVKERPIHYRKLIPLLRQIYGEFLPTGRFPFAILFLKIPSEEIDVNVHPQKKEVRFKKEEEVLNFLERALKSVIEKKGFYTPRELKAKESFPISTVERAKEETFPFLPQLNLAQDEDLWEGKEEKILFPQKIHTRLFGTFILATSEEGLFLIDQHTAEERVQYEEFLDLLKKQKNLKQELALPIPLILNPMERQSVGQNKEKLSELGFLLENLGPAGYQITAVPFYIKAGEEEKALKIALSIVERDPYLNVELLFEQIAKNLACRSAIKKGEDLPLPQAEELVFKLLNSKVPLRCPHGRPTVVFWGKKDIFPLFLRSL